MCWVLKICSILMFKQFWKRAGITPTSCVLPCERGSFASDAAYESTAEERLRRKETQVNHVGTEAHLSVPDAQSHTQSHPCSINKENALLCFVPKLSNTFCSFQRVTLSFASGYYSFVARACKMPYWTLRVQVGWRQFPELYTHNRKKIHCRAEQIFPKESNFQICFISCNSSVTFSGSKELFINRCLFHLFSLYPPAKLFLLLLLRLHDPAYLQNSQGGDEEQT